MFYSHDILSRRGGRFSILWLAATKGRKLTRREYAKVDIEQMCEDIINYLPTHRMNSEMKFSLYLSSQLMYGVIIVYSKQQEYLLYDLKKAQEFLQSAPILCPIDMPNVNRNIDAADNMRNRADIPFGYHDFGRIDFSPKIASTVSLGLTNDEDLFSIHTASLLESLEGSAVGFPIAPHTVHPSKITLREEVAMIVREFGQGQDDDLLPPYEDFYATMVAIADENVNLEQLEGDKGLPSSSPRLSAVSNVEETPTVLNPPESPGVVGAPPRASKPRTPEVTVAELEIGPEPEKAQARFLLSPLGAEAERGYLFTRKGRRVAKRLKIDDMVTISSAGINDQIENHTDTSVTLNELIIDPIRAGFSAKSDWWRNTSIEIASTRLTEMYRANTFVTRTEMIDMNEVWNSPPWTIPHEFHYQPSAGAAQEFINNFQQTDQVEPILEEEPGQMTTSTVEQEREMSSRRETSKESILLPRPSNIYEPPVDDLLRQMEDFPMQDLDERSRLEEDISREIPPRDVEEIEPENEPPRSKRARVRSPPPVDHLEQCFPAVTDLPNSEAKTFALRREQLKSDLKEKTAGGRVITFQDLVPLNKTRAQAGKTFYMLLDLIGRGFVYAEQRRPYEEIRIFKGTRVGAKR